MLCLLKYFCLVKHYAMKAHVVVNVFIHEFFTSALIGGEWAVSCLKSFTYMNRTHDSHWIGGWVNPGTSLDDVKREKSCSCQVSQSATLAIQSLCTDCVSCILYVHEEYFVILNIRLMVLHTCIWGEVSTFCIKHGYCF
jgi:hypothetical protein